jgi:Predicted integral membrane protein
MAWLKERFQKEGAGQPAPETGWARLGVMALTHFWKLITANLLFVLFSLPVITLPAALTALNRVCVIIYKDGNIFLWEEFRKEFKRSILRSILPGLGFALLLFGGYFFMSLGNGNLQRGFVGVVFWAFGILMAAVAVILGEYFFVVSSVLDIGVGGAMKNSLLLWMSRPGSGLLILVWVALLSVAMAVLLPIGLVLLLLIWAVLAQYPVSFLVYDVTEDLVLIPYEEQQRQKEADG